LENCAYLWKNPGYAPAEDVEHMTFLNNSFKIPFLKPDFG